MAWYPDLSPCDYFGLQLPSLLAVGWLERTHEFTIGAVDQGVFLRLKELLQAPWEPCQLRGMHDCEFCLYDPPMGYKNLFIPAVGVIYVCPELIAHYMNAHHYQPPEEFCQAVLNCPEMRSNSYSRAILANGGRELVRLGKRTP